jgi:hypothetical protein
MSDIELQVFVDYNTAPRPPSVEEVIEWLPEKFWDAMAFYLSGIRPEFTPTLMRLRLAEAVAAAYEEMGI